MIKGVALKTVLVALDAVTSIADAVWDCVNMVGAINEYEQAKVESFNNNQLLHHFGKTIKKHLEFEKCEVMSEVSVSQRLIDKQRAMLKSLFIKEEKNLKEVDPELTKELVRRK